MVRGWWLVFLVVLVGRGEAGWLRPSAADPRPLWGLEGGIRFSIAPASVEGPDFGGPRGLIRVGYPSNPDGGSSLINFIAIEPVAGFFPRRGLSELEASATDGQPGKRLWVMGDAPPGNLDPGLLERRADGVELLHVRINCERFDNGAHVYVVATLATDRPDEVRFSVHALPDSSRIHSCTLSATMGNKTRVRQVYLANRILDSRTTYGYYRGINFARDAQIPARSLRRDARGDVVVPFRSDERDPAAVHPFPDDPWAWYYPGKPLTQYWKKPADSPQDDLHLRVNGRYTYWRSEQPIPGGVAFENVELRDAFADGEAWIYGITPGSPESLFAPAGAASSLLGVGALLAGPR